MIKLVNKVLYRPAKPVTDFRAAYRLGREMLTYITRPKTWALGLAAPQVGVSKRMFVINVDGYLGIVINPTIVDNASEICDDNEGCLSFPGKTAVVSRPTSIVVSYHSIEVLRNPDEVYLPLTGLAARCFLHEYDHLDGITMFDRTRGSNA